MDKHVSEIAVILLGGCITGITYERWIEMASISYYEGSHQSLIFSVCLLTSIFATAWICLFMMRSGNRILGQVSFGLHIIVVIFWLACIIESATSKLHAYYKGDLVLSCICFVLSLGSTVILGLLGVWR